MNKLVVKDDTGANVFADCHCGCDSGLRIRVDMEDVGDLYVIVSYTSADFYKNQATWFSGLKLKLQKVIWEKLLENRVKLLIQLEQL